MVLRLLMWSPADRRLHGCSASLARRGKFPNRVHWEQLFFTLRRSWGAIGRYQRAPGGLCAAAGVPRRPMDGANGITGGGKGLTLVYTHFLAMFRASLYAPRSFPVRI